MPNFPQPKVLVTGASGFIGHHLVRELTACGYWVRGVDLQNPAWEPSPADEFLKADLTSWESCLLATEGISAEVVDLLTLNPLDEETIFESVRRTHRLVVNFSYQIPSVNFARRILGGWQLAGVAIMQSGTPFSILDSSGAAIYGTANSRASWASGATIASAQGSGRTQDRLNQYYNTAAFVRSGNLFGDTGRNILRGPNQRNFDLSVNKHIPINDRYSLEWRSEFFNLLNIANFANPGGGITAASLGTIRSTTGNPRVIQMALKFAF